MAANHSPHASLTHVESICTESCCRSRMARNRVVVIVVAFTARLDSKTVGFAKASASRCVPCRKHGQYEISGHPGIEN